MDAALRRVLRVVRDECMNGILVNTDVKRSIIYILELSFLLARIFFAKGLADVIDRHVEVEAAEREFRLHLPRRRARRGRCLLRERRVAALAGAARQFLVSKSADRDDEHDDDADEDGLRGVPFGRWCLRRICFLRWRRRR